jgi:hypothetical protein
MPEPEQQEQQEDLAEDVLNVLDATHQKDVTVYAEKTVINNINRGLKRTVEGILLTGEWLTIARGKGGPCASMTTAGWDAWLRKNVSLDKGEASKYMAIWANPVFRSVSQVKQFDKLPRSYTTLYALATGAKDSRGTELLQQLLDADELGNVTRDQATEIVGKLKGKPKAVTSNRPSATVLKAKLDETESDLFTVRDELEATRAELEAKQRQLDNARDIGGQDNDESPVPSPEIAAQVESRLPVDIAAELADRLGEDLFRQVIAEGQKILEDTTKVRAAT